MRPRLCAEEVTKTEYPSDAKKIDEGRFKRISPRSRGRRVNRKDTTSRRPKTYATTILKSLKFQADLKCKLKVWNQDKDMSIIKTLTLEETPQWISSDTLKKGRESYGKETDRAKKKLKTRNWPSGQYSRTIENRQTITTVEETVLEELLQSMRTLDKMFRKVMENYHQVSTWITDDPGLAHWGVLVNLKVLEFLNLNTSYYLQRFTQFLEYFKFYISENI